MIKLIVPLKNLWWDTDLYNVLDRILPIIIGDGLSLEKFDINPFLLNEMGHEFIDGLFSKMDRDDLNECDLSICRTLEEDTEPKRREAYHDVDNLLTSMRIVRPMRAYPLCRLIIDGNETKFLQKLNDIPYIYDPDDFEKEELKERDVEILRVIHLAFKECFKVRKRLWNAHYMYGKSFFEYYSDYRLVFLAIALESLFNTDPVEVTYKIANRSSWFLGEDKIERRELFGQIKSAYRYRSKVVHGGTIPNKDISTLYDYTKMLTLIMQKVLLKILRDNTLIKRFDGDNENLGAYFDGLTLGIDE
jgi:hypothetical protein